MDEEVLALEEAQRIIDLLNGYNVNKHRINMLSSVIENVSWMKVKLDKTREAIKTSSVVIPYDNGGGQKGIRENPLFKGYESLWKSYISGMEKILAALPAEAQAIKEEVEKPKTMLELVRNKHKKEA